jgi:ankyrin repeat protein
VGASVNRRNHDELTPAMLAAVNGHSQVMDVLASHDADLSLVVDGGGKRPKGSRRDPSPLKDRIYQGL